MRNANHPKKGSVIRVEPVRNVDDIERIKNNLKSNPRNFCLFVMGINTNLRASDLLKIKVDQVKNLYPGNSITIREQKTQKTRSVVLNRAVVGAVNGLLKNIRQDREYLFQSNKGVLPITVEAFSRMVKGWCAEAGLSGSFAAHSLRKTFGYQQRVRFGVGIEVLMKCFNHSNQGVTLRYLGIDEREVNEVFNNEL